MSDTYMTDCHFCGNEMDMLSGTGQVPVCDDCEILIMRTMRYFYKDFGFREDLGQIEESAQKLYNEMEGYKDHGAWKKCEELYLLLPTKP